MRQNENFRCAPIRFLLILAPMPEANATRPIYVRVSDDVFRWLRDRAAENYRSISKEAAFLLDSHREQERVESAPEKARP